MQMLEVLIFVIPAVGIMKKVFEGYHNYQKIVKCLGEKQTEWILRQGGRNE
jgi:hypothetical protein